jgi:hypothetical protein
MNRKQLQYINVYCYLLQPAEFCAEVVYKMEVTSQHHASVALSNKTGPTCHWTGGWVDPTTDSLRSSPKPIHITGTKMLPTNIHMSKRAWLLHGADRMSVQCSAARLSSQLYPITVLTVRPDNTTISALRLYLPLRNLSRPLLTIHKTLLASHRRSACPVHFLFSLISKYRKRKM